MNSLSADDQHDIENIRAHSITLSQSNRKLNKNRLHDGCKKYLCIVSEGHRIISCKYLCVAIIVLFHYTSRCISHRYNVSLDLVLLGRFDGRVNSFQVLARSGTGILLAR